MERRLAAGLLVALLALAACSSSPTEDAVPTAASSVDSGIATTTPVDSGGSDDSAASTLPDSTTTPDSATVVPPATGESLDISTTPGTEIGSASTGPTITNPVPWDTGSIYVDDTTPEFFELDFNPPDPDCIAAEAIATVGRGGAVLLSLFVDGDHVSGTPCSEESGNNRLALTLDEPLAGRRIYTDSSVYYGDETVAAERLSDEVIGLELDDAITVIDEAGFQSEVIPADPGERESIFIADRINLYLARDGTVEFATPG